MNEVKTRSTIIELLNQLTEDKRTIRGWHGMGMPAEHEKSMWSIYEQTSPEMKKLNAAIDKAETWLNDQSNEKKDPVNLNESAAYATGLIKGNELLFEKLRQRILKKEFFKRQMFDELRTLIDEANEFPTIKEAGKFVGDPAKEKVVFQPKK